MPHICVCLCQIYLTVLYSVIMVILLLCLFIISLSACFALSMSLFLRHLLCMLVMSAKSSLELVLYCFIYIPTLNKSYLILVRWWQWKSSEKKKGMCSYVCRPGATGVSLCTMETVGLPNIQRELKSSFGTKLPEKGGSVADSTRGNLYCLASELAFLVMR
jgi:hypothetical protein